MKTITAILITIVIAGCGAQSMPDDHISELTERLQPMADGWQKNCKIGRRCLEANPEESKEIIKEYIEICETGWSILQAIEAYQTAYCILRGLECSKISLE